MHVCPTGFATCKGKGKCRCVKLATCGWYHVAPTGCVFSLVPFSGWFNGTARWGAPTKTPFVAYPTGVRSRKSPSVPPWREDAKVGAQVSGLRRGGAQLQAPRVLGSMEATRIPVWQNGCVVLREHFFVGVYIYIHIFIYSERETKGNHGLYCRGCP